MEGYTIVNIIQWTYDHIPSFIIALTVAGVYYFRGPDAVMLTLSMSVVITLANRYRISRNEKKDKDLPGVLEE